MGAAALLAGHFTGPLFPWTVLTVLKVLTVLSVLTCHHDSTLVPRLPKPEHTFQGCAFRTVQMSEECATQNSREHLNGISSESDAEQTHWPDKTQIHKKNHNILYMYYETHPLEEHHCVYGSTWIMGSVVVSYVIIYAQYMNILVNNDIHWI